MFDRLRRALRRAREQFPRLNNLYEWARGRKFPLFLEFPVRPRPRWGYCAPQHAALASFLNTYSGRFRAAFREMLEYKEDFGAIRRASGDDPSLPHWDNGTFPSLDAMALHMFLAKLNPKQYVEIGSGHSTRFARRAIGVHRLRTKVVSIDPQPRVEVDALCDVTIRAALEDQDVSLFSGLEAGDILFFDGSHFSYQNSDTVVFFLDILPRLAPGVWVQIHDITWPRDYGPEVVGRYFTEQYLLGAYIVGGASRMDVQLANHFAIEQLGLARMLDPVFACPNLQGVARVGASFWFSVT